jgi:hypothetical protein
MDKETIERNSTDEIEVTPEMAEAGAAAFYRGDQRFESAEVIVTRIYRNMEKFRRVAHSSKYGASP